MVLSSPRLPLNVRALAARSLGAAAARARGGAAPTDSPKSWLGYKQSGVKECRRACSWHLAREIEVSSHIAELHLVREVALSYREVA